MQAARGCRSRAGELRSGPDPGGRAEGLAGAVRSRSGKVRRTARLVADGRDAGYTLQLLRAPTEPRGAPRGEVAEWLNAAVSKTV
jgi:hypothetical protein